MQGTLCEHKTGDLTPAKKLKKSVLRKRADLKS